MRLILSNNHILFELEGDNYLIDTGSPMSFSFFDKRSISLNQKTYEFSKIKGCSKSEVDQLARMNVSGIIGMDIISKTSLTVDYENNKIEFNQTNIECDDNQYASFEFSLFMGGYITTQDLCCNGIKFRNCVIDSGAHISYIKENLLRSEDELNEQYSDYSPKIGEISGYFYSSIISSSNYDLSVKVGKMPFVLASLFDGIIGFNALSNKLISIDFKNNRIIFKK